MPAFIPLSDSHNTPANVVLSLSLSCEELARFSRMVGELAYGEYELAEDLQDMGRSFDEPLARAALALRVLAAADVVAAL